MAAITRNRQGIGSFGKIRNRDYGTGTANQADTLTSDDKGNRRFLMATCSYSASPTQAGVTVTLISALGSAYDVLLYTGSANVQDNFYLPDGPIELLQGDAIQVAAPAGGGGITAAITIVTEPA
ncbi:MAG: hypothetical protein AB7E70_20150 [Hyphomicrobiaceae bacterium]